MRGKCAGIGMVFFVALLGGWFVGARQATHSPMRVCVTAVHDSSLFTLCPPDLRTALVSRDYKRLTKPWGSTSDHLFKYLQYTIWVKPYDMLSISYNRFPSDTVQHMPTGLPPPFVPDAAGILEPSRLDWQVLGRRAIGVCPSGWIDAGMLKEIEAELNNKNKDYELVDSAERSDVVLLVEGLYGAYWDPEGRGGMQYNDVESFFPERQLRKAAIAVAVPSKIYRRDPADPEALLRSRVWAGASVWKGASFSLAIKRGVDTYLSVRSASIKELMSRFFKNAKWDSAIPPVCPAWLPRPNDAPNVNLGKGANITRDSGGSTPILPTQQARPLPSGNAIRTETVLVTVPLVASDADGTYVSGLAAEDFRLFEDGVEQKIDQLIGESTPFYAALIMDTSYSTTFIRSDIDSAALKFLEALGPDDQLMALSMSSVVLIDSEFTGDRSRLQSSIAQAAARSIMPYKQQSNTTNYMGSRLYDAIDLSVTERLNDITGRKAILLFTDGIDVGSRLATAASTLARIEESGVPVYVVRYETPLRKTKYRNADAAAAAVRTRGAQYLQDLAARSGGRILHASKGADLQAAFSAIAEELRHQYTLCYYPTGPLKDGTFHRLQVTVDRPGVKLHARPGYRVIR